MGALSREQYSSVTELVDSRLSSYVARLAMAERRGNAGCSFPRPSRAIRLTQFFLKQSWEQKKLSLIPSFRHVGHCSEPASFSQSALRHLRLVGGSSVMMGERQKSVVEIWMVEKTAVGSQRKTEEKPRLQKNDCKKEK